MVIVGGGFGGLYAAKELRRAPVQVTIVDRRNHHLFQPLLYQVATAALSPGNIAYPIRSIVRRQANTRVLLGEALTVDVHRRELVLDHGRLPYDYLILATGAGQAYFGHPEWEPLAPGLKSLEDAIEIRGRILSAFERAEWETDLGRRRALLTFVIVGGGPTGVELAGAIAEISRQVLVSDFRAIDPREARVLLVEAAPRILHQFPEDLADRAERALLRLQVEVRKGSPVTALERGVVQVGNERIAAETVVWAAGVAASPLGRSLGVPLDRAGRVIVEQDLTIPGHPEVFVIGDLAAAQRQDGTPVPGLAPAAIQEGRHAARNVLRESRGESLAPFRYVDKGSLATIGRASAIADIAGFHLSGVVAWLVWIIVHVLFLIGFRNRVIVLFEWAWSYLTFQRGARLITGEIRSGPPGAAGAGERQPAVSAAG
ncbi:MAG: hypothetical protein QOD06_640 [Candidatus Binatota bacterium]|nr:hypothetical protein [Candidatus Binatota bacterium]